MATDERVIEHLGAGARAPAAWPPVLPTFATLVAVALFVTAGNWQRARFDTKESLRAQIDAASAALPVALPRGVDDWNQWRFRPVLVTGTFDAKHQILIDNRVHAGTVGFDVVSSLNFDDGILVLFDRG